MQTASCRKETPIMRVMTAAVLLAGLTLASDALAQGPAIAFGDHHAVALRDNGDVLVWGTGNQCASVRSLSDATPTLVMRNAKEVAAGARHTLVLTKDGKVYGWGINPQGELGTGNTNDVCQGPVPVPSLDGKGVTHIATGYGFSLAVTSTGDLYCTGDNSMGQCPAARGARSNRVEAFALVPMQELAGHVASVSAGSFHALVLTKDGRVYAFGRGRDGQLGNGRADNGFALVPDLTDVVSIAAGTWHSIAARRDGSVWTWGNDSRSQLCDGATVNRNAPAKIDVPGVVTQVAAGGHTTAMKLADGTVYVCGENQSGALGVGGETIAARPTKVTAPPVKSSVVVFGGAISAISPDGCAVRLAGTNDDAIIGTTGDGSRTFAPRAQLSLCAPAATTPLPDVVNPMPVGGKSGCWTPRVESDESTSQKWAPLREALLTSEGLFKKNTAFLAAPEPVRFRTGLSIGPLNDSGGMMHIKAVPEKKKDGFRIWTGDCDVIPQIDRIGGPIAQVSVFTNVDARVDFIGSGGEPPKLTGHVAGYPEYNGWVVITKDGRLPWIPQTLDDKLTAELAKRERALADYAKSAAPVAAWTSEYEKQVRDCREYRASFSSAQLQMAAVSGDPSGDGKRQLNTRLAQLQAFSPEEQRQIDDLSRESNAAGRQAQVEATTNHNAAEAARLRAHANDLANQVRALRQAHIDSTSPLVADANAQYQLMSLEPGDAAHAISVKRDPAFPDTTTPNRVQVVTVAFFFTTDPRDTTLFAWGQRTKESFDFAALAALLR